MAFLQSNKYLQIFSKNAVHMSMPDEEMGIEVDLFHGKVDFKVDRFEVEKSRF
jgi:hypothetical protein